MKQKHGTWPKIRLGLAVASLALLIAFIARYSLTYGQLPPIEINFRWGILITGLLFAFMAGFISYYEYHGVGNQDGITRKFNKGSYVSLTFDDGPSPKYTPIILDVLKDYGIKATFFVVGKHVKKYPEISKRIVAEGHDIGNHTYNHRELVPATKATVVKEITRTEQVLLDVVNLKTDLFRPPRGIYSQAVRKLLIERGYKIILWSLSSCDWRGTTAGGILKRVKRHVKNGSIILFHDSGAIMRKEGGKRGNTIKALPLVIELLKENGYRIVPLSEIINTQEAGAEAEPVEI